MIIELKPLIATNKECCQKQKLDKFVIKCEKCGEVYTSTKYVNSVLIEQAEEYPPKEKGKLYRQYVYILTKKT